LLREGIAPLGRWLSAEGGSVAQWNAVAGEMPVGFALVAVGLWRLSKRVKVLETAATTSPLWRTPASVSPTLGSTKCS
jgi:hypothetical protein